MSEIASQYLSEHEAPNRSDSGQSGYQPSAEDKKTIQMVDSMYSKAKKYRKRYDGRWLDWYKMFRGRQWKEVRPSYRSSEVLNLVFQTIESMIPILTDSKPKLEFLPTVQSQFELAQILTKVVENDWEHNNWLEVLTEILLDSHLYGTAFGYVGYNPKAEMGLGNIEFESSDPFYIFPDPQARDINGKRTKYFIHAEPEDISEVKKQYPDVAKYISSDIVDFSQADKADIYQVNFKSPVDSKLIVEGPSGYDSTDKNQCLKITLYSKDDDFDEEEQLTMNDDGTPKMTETGEQEKSYVQVKKYPNGRKIVIAGGVLCEDNDFEFEDGLFPYVKMVNYQLPREFWGMGEVEQLDSPQKTINKILGFVIDALMLMGNPIYIVDDTSGVDTDNLFNKPGLIIEKTAGSEIRRESGVEIPSFVLPLLDRYKTYFDGISGQTDLSRGAEPSNVEAASAIEDLQEAQRTRLRLKSRHIDSFLQDFGKLYLSRVFQYYSTPRIVRVSGDDNADQFFSFHVEKLEGPDGKITRIANVIADGEAKKYEIVGDFDIRCVTGTSLPFAKSSQENRSMKLYQLGVIDDEALLKDIDYPNAEQVLQRVQAKKAQAQQQKMQMDQHQMQLDTQEKQTVKATPEGAFAMMHGQPPPPAA